MNKPDAAPVFELIDAYRRSQTMFTAAGFGLFDRLALGATADCATLAVELAANPSGLERLLDTCVGLGLLTRNAGGYTNSALADTYLYRQSPDSMLGYVLYSKNALYPMWAHLTEAIQEGSHRWTQTFGIEGPLFSHFFRTEEAMQAFLMGMHGYGMQSSPLIVSAFDLSRFRCMADLGGATGHLALAACEYYPNMRGIVFDLPPVIRFAKQRVEHPRLEFVAGDFFADPLPNADLYAIGRILHDWNEHKIRTLLKKIYEQLPAGGGLLIGEKLLLEDGTGPLPAQLMSLNMLICTEGRERRPSEYEALLRETGFSTIRHKWTGSVLDVVLAEK